MPRARILIAEDDRKTVASLRLYLEHAGFDVLVAPDGRRALALARAAPPPDLVVLDVMLPYLDGFAVCRALRAETSIPINLLTARSTEEDRLEGLDLGADDYVTKPFSPRELTARVRAVLRRAPGAAGEAAPGPPIRIRGLSLDPARHEVRVRGKGIDLTPREFRLLEALARSPGRAFTREELVARAFGPDYEGLERTIDAHIVNLRRKLEAGSAAPRLIETVFGVGYRFASRRTDA